MRRIVCAAIRAEDGELVLGVRHYDMLMRDAIESHKTPEKFYHRYDDDQGFVDNQGLYYRRKAAYVIAEQAGQIINYTACPSKELYSEGLY